MKTAKEKLRLFKRYLINILVALDQLLNTIFGGDPDETMSSRAGKDRDRGRIVGCILCKFLDIFERDHCTKSIERDRGKRPGQYDKPQ